MQRTRVLTGITTTGTPHLGNYAGALRPAIEASQREDVDAFFFLADYHALIKCDDPTRVARSRLEIAATWLAAGLDYDRVTFYRQSDIPEIPELSWILTCMTPKGLMNRAHAYKASVDQNVAKNTEPDDGITMGLYSYPILMAADILMFNANIVPVGKDQVQHLEMARDIAQRFNHHYGHGREYFVLPDVQVDEDVATLPGLDGRKMSKSYGNTIPLFEGGRKELKAAIARIQTDSKLPGEPKETEGSHLFSLYKAFATTEQTQAFKQALEEGLAWGQAKEELFTLLDGLLSPMRERYESLMAKPQEIEDILQVGASKARQYAAPFIKEIREAVGLRNTAITVSANKETSKKAKSARFVSFRDSDGKFMFRLLAANGQEILLSKAFANPKEAGISSKAIVNIDMTHDIQVRADEGFDVLLNGEVIASSVNATNPESRIHVLALLEESLNQLKAE
ncbi:tryptophanyl-tRNA synthetase [Pelistega indica]|uniref:Tryptophan--tRNA ligase n=1 Tax=Pelistega indica TaxID=1414851 RepID=V8G802_9BURK|nr:tryptophan--tRNA ligase [Pelistega indica]ETD72236.1 tryptophanyl-tRNA synthetase [Pelistega indica]